MRIIVNGGEGRGGHSSENLLYRLNEKFYPLQVFVVPEIADTLEIPISKREQNFAVQDFLAPPVDS